MTTQRTDSVLIPLTGIFVMQSVITMAAYSISVVIPLAAMDLQLAPESVGFLVSLNYAVSMIVGLGSGVLIQRLGATGVFRLLLALVSVGSLGLWLLSPITAFIVVALFGAASGPMNPAGSHVLGRITNANNRAFLFSIKQCGTPAGGMFAGVLLPPLALAFGWQWAMMLIPALSVVLILAAPLARLGPKEPTANNQRRGMDAIRKSLRVVMADRAIRNVTIAGTLLAMSQMALASYLVVYLWREAGLTEAAAGLVFAFMHISGITSRVILGAIADRFVSSKWVLVGICAVLSISLVLTSQFNESWPLVAIYAVTCFTGATGNGWVGLYFSELARLSPEDQIGDIAGGSQFFSHGGLVVGPLVFGAMLKLTGSFDICLLFFAACAFVTTIILARSDLTKSGSK